LTIVTRYVKVEEKVYNDWFTLIDQDPNIINYNTQFTVNTSYATKQLRVTIGGRYDREWIHPNHEWSQSKVFDIQKIVEEHYGEDYINHLEVIVIDHYDSHLLWTDRRGDISLWYINGDIQEKIQ